MKVAIIDDEQHAREVITSVLTRSAPELQIKGTAGTVEEALQLLQKETFDLIFLDNEFPDGRGIDILKSLPEINFKVIFVTGYRDYAVEAFKFSAVDYLLKPVDPVELINAVNKVREQLEHSRDHLLLETLVKNLQQDQKKTIVLKTNDVITVVGTDEITRCEGEGSYTTFHLHDGRHIVVSKGLRFYEELLGGYSFFRVHQSHLINLNEVESYIKTEESIRLKSGQLVPLATRRKEAFLSTLGF